MKRFVLAVFAAMLLAVAAVPVALAEGPSPTGCEHIKTHASDHVPDSVCG